MSSQPPAQSLALTKCIGIIVLKAETTAFVPCRVSAKGSVNSAAVYYFCRWQGPEVSALQRLQPKAKVNSRENPVRLAPGHAKLATRSCSQETCKENWVLAAGHPMREAAASGRAYTCANSQCPGHSPLKLMENELGRRGQPWTLLPPFVPSCLFLSLFSSNIH